MSNKKSEPNGSFLCYIDERFHNMDENPLKCNKCGVYVCTECFTALVIKSGIIQCINCKGALESLPARTDAKSIDQFPSQSGVDIP